MLIQEISVYWNKCQSNVWCQLNSVNLAHQHFDNMEGVYIIWHGGNNPKTVRVGQGVIRDRLQAHRLDNEVQQYSAYTLFVTWAQVSANQRDGVERYLAEALNPLVGERFPDVTPIQVNLPW